MKTCRYLHIATLLFCLGSPVAAQDFREVSSVEVRGQTIRVGMLFDDAVAALKPEDRIADPVVTKDRRGSLIVTHTYRIDGKTIRLQARRFEDPGPYRVAGLWVGR